ncbi:ABC transporter permease [soil metagenome]
MNLKPVLLWTDLLLYLLFFIVVLFIFWARHREHLRNAWKLIINRKLGIISLLILLTYIALGLLDSLHFREAFVQRGNNGAVHYSSEVKSVLDKLLKPLGENEEKTYSAPFASQLYTKELVLLANGQQISIYPALKFGGANLSELHRSKLEDILIRLGMASVKSLIVLGSVILLLLLISLTKSFVSVGRAHVPAIGEPPTAGTCADPTASARSTTCWYTLLITLGILIWFSFAIKELSYEYHILGTDKVGQDVLFFAIKSILTGLIIGTLTTLFMLPFAIFLGIMAGYFRGWVDDAIQYLYTTLSSIPAVLLIAASILSLQMFIGNHPNLFTTMAARADARLLALCAILGITSWTSLCRLLRGETLKLREMDFIQAAYALGVSHYRIMLRHILPNVMHIVLISVVLDFSGLVLAEAVLSYVGVGVDPTTMSWGNMINTARLELAREPVVWWPLLAAFILMFVLVLAANVFSDCVRDAFDPRMRRR